MIGAASSKLSKYVPGRCDAPCSRYLFLFFLLTMCLKSENRIQSSAIARRTQSSVKLSLRIIFSSSSAMCLVIFAVLSQPAASPLDSRWADSWSVSVGSKSVLV